MAVTLSALSLYSYWHHLQPPYLMLAAVCLSLFFCIITSILAVCAVVIDLMFKAHIAMLYNTKMENITMTKRTFNRRFINAQHQERRLTISGAGSYGSHSKDPQANMPFQCSPTCKRHIFMDAMQDIGSADALVAIIDTWYNSARNYVFQGKFSALTCAIQIFPYVVAPTLICGLSDCVPRIYYSTCCYVATISGLVVSYYTIQSQNDWLGSYAVQTDLLQKKISNITALSSVYFDKKE